MDLSEILMDLSEIRMDFSESENPSKSISIDLALFQSPPPPFQIQF